MPVDKFGKHGFDDKRDILLSSINISYVRRDGTNTVIGSLDMMGNTLNNVGNPTSNQDVATKAYRDSSSAADKVSKSGDTITVDLRINVGSGTERFRGRTDLTEGKDFHWRWETIQLQFGGTIPVTMQTTNGFLVKVNDTDVIQLTSLIHINKRIAMKENRILNVPDPNTSYEPATKNYVDSRT